MSNMKYKDLREKVQKGSLKNNKVHKATLAGVDVEIKKNKNKYTVLIDGEELDTYNTQRQAETMAKNFLRQYKR